MRSGTIAAGLAATVLAGCGQGGEAGPVTAPVAPVAVAAPPVFVGIWAARPELCRGAPWRLTAETLTAASGPACLLDHLSPHATGWSATATCADGEAGLIELNPHDGPPQTLVISGAGWGAPATLVRCPEAGTETPSADPHALLTEAAKADLRIARGGEAIHEVRTPNNLVVRAVWRSPEGILKIAEPLVGGQPRRARRDYYYRPGETTPFLIRDPQGAYGFVDGRLTAVFSPEGAIVPADQRPDPEIQQRRLMRQERVVHAEAQTLGAPAS